MVNKLNFYSSHVLENSKSLLSNISGTLKEKYENFSKNQLLESEKRHEDEYVHGELMWQYKKEQIIQSWAGLLHWMHDTGHYKKPLSTISTYIKNRLRIRGVSEGAIDYVSEILVDDYAIYKDSIKDTYRYRLDGNPSRASIFETFQEMANQVRTKQDIERFTYAEFLETFDIFEDKDKEIRSRLRDYKEDFITVAHEKNWKIPRLQKTSAQFPPEQFWGQSELYFNCRENARQHGVMMDYWNDTAELVYKYKPNDEVSEQASQYLNRLSRRVWNPLFKLNLYTLRGMKDMLGMVSDAKNCQPLLDWIETGYDKEVKAGSHGAGVLHAIETGQYIMELGKDGRSVIELPIEREFTREQCGDKIAKLLIKARNILVMHECERFIQSWSKQAEFEVIMKDPDEFYRAEMTKKGRKIPDE